MPELSFKGKEFVFNHHLAVPHRPLVPDAAKSVGEPRLDGNLIIHGDNLHALKSLLPMYAGKVDCIFIDPPYNTGNEGWCYNDNVNSPMMQQWLNENPVGIEDGLRHDKWCAMMWPRLRLFRELLTSNGVLLVCIDDNEQQSLRAILDDIFGRYGFLSTFVWRRRIGSSMAMDWVSTDHEYVVAYSKLPKEVNVTGSERDMSKYNIPDGTGRFYASMPLTVGMTKDMRPNQWYELINPRTGKGYWPANGRVWGYYPPTMKEKVAAGLIIWPDDYPDKKMTTPRLKTYPEDAKRDRKPVSSWLDNTGRTEEGTKVLKDIFGEVRFSYPKPLSLVQTLVEQFAPSHSVVLDSFAGSGTTAHAVLAANQKDGGERKFILVECEEYADNLTAERVRRVIDGYSFMGTQREELLKRSLTFTDLKNSTKLLQQIAGIENMESYRFDKIEKKVKDGELLVEGVKSITDRVEGLGGSFTYCTLGEAIDMEKMLTGENLPGFEQLGALLFHTATNEVIDPAKIDVKDGHGYLGESSSFHVWLIYKPELDFLKSRDSALTLTKAKEFAASKPGKRHLVFAPAKFVSQKVLDEERVPVEFAPLPWALYRIDRSR